MLCAFYFLNKRGAYGIVGGRDVYQQGLTGVWLVEDRWGGQGCFEFLENLFTIISPREPGGFL